jgi:hypothetical protein
MAKGLIDAGGGKAVDDNFIVVANQKLRLAEDPEYVSANNPSIKQNLSEVFEDGFELLSADDFNFEFYPKPVLAEQANDEVTGDGTGQTLPPLADGEEEEEEEEEEEKTIVDANNANTETKPVVAADEKEDEDVFKTLEIKDKKPKK